MREQRGAKQGMRGAELVEFALALPILLLLVVGIWDFGAAFGLRQKTTNAAREAARIVVSSSLTDLSCASATPCSIVAAANSVVQYLGNAGLNASCILPESPTSSTAVSWTYTCASGLSLTINRGYTISTASGLMPATQVTLLYPFSWHLASFLKGYAQPSLIYTQVTMANLVS